MIDKKTRKAIMELLIRRRLRLGYKSVDVISLYDDLNSVRDYVGVTMDEMFPEKGRYT